MMEQTMDRRLELSRLSAGIGVDVTQRVKEEYVALSIGYGVVLVVLWLIAES